MRFGALVLLLALSWSSFSPGASSGPVEWKPWTEDVFATAKKENRFVILYLEAVWCHWCHVMDEKTYRDPKVVELLRKRYLPVRVDQDSRPDLSLRYEDYGWPATIVFDGTGQEIVKRRGYIPPDVMASLLQAIIDDPTPGPSVQAEAEWTVPTGKFLTAEQEKKFESTHRDAYDRKVGGWGRGNKFLEWESAEWALVRARAGDKEEERRVRATLKLQMTKLLDPVWGGVYQYSSGDSWDEPHFEKLLRFQAENVRVLALAYSIWKEKAHLDAAESIVRYVDGFLTSPEGAFYVSQDADLKKGVHAEGYFKLSDRQRRKKGMPAIDRNLYSRENGWMIQAYAALYGATGKAEYLARAKRAAAWVEKNRASGDGGYRHGEKDSGGPYLDDTLAMARAWLSLYVVTADRTELMRAEAALDWLAKTFPFRKGDRVVGFAASRAPAGLLLPKPNRDENIRLARFANLLHHYTGKQAHRDVAESAMRYLAVPETAVGVFPGGVLLANRELQKAPIHITVVGAKEDAAAKALFGSAIAYPSGYLRVEWWDRKEGRLPNQDVTYPELPKAAAFACTDKRCSLPIFDAAQLREKVEKVAELM